MFNPCIDGKCTGKDRTGWGFDEGRVSVADLQHTLKEEYGIEL